MKLIAKPYAFVRWLDAHTSGTTELGEYEIPHAAADYVVGGWVLKHDGAGITLASEYSGQNTYRGINFIPAGMIAEVLYVKLSKVKVVPPAAATAPPAVSSLAGPSQ